MAKQSGLGDNFYIGGYNLSGDVGSLGNISTPRGVFEDTAISSSAMERLQLLADGQVEFTTFFNDATSQEHDALKALPTTDTSVFYFRGTTLGNAAAAMTAKQINYDGNRAADGGFTFTVQAQGNSYGLEWGQMLTAGIRTDTTATASSGAASVDTAASASFGIQAYLQVFSFSGTSCTVRIQDSADNSSFANISGLNAFTAATGRTFERIASTNTTTVRRYLAVTTSGTFSSCAFAVVAVKNAHAGVVF